MTSTPVPLEEISHLTLSVGRILFQNNADTEEVLESVQRFAKVFACDVHLLVTYESLLLTVTTAAGEFRTKAGNRVPAMNVNMAAVAAVKTLVVDVETARGAMAATEIRQRLEAIEHQPPIYNRWLVIAGLSLTAASLSRLFGGDWPTFFVTLVAGAVGTWLRQELGRRGWNLFFVAFAAALASGLAAGVAVFLKLSTMPALCLAAPGMIIVPGVPLVNGVQDMIKNHMSIGISRLGLATMITLAIAVGLFGAMALTGARIAVDEASVLPPLAEDALFSACAALGYLFLFNVPARLAWVCILCGVASHTTRTFCLQHHVDIVTGSLIGALVVGFLAHGFARHFRAPASAFAFPGVVAMIPGAFAFRAVIGYLQIVGAGATASPA
ncbi:MAG TPA: threonine/serine exporter family protein, partial [Chthoniobacterales bacterium]|nr:threonine/serine exporter family protein [Chthoniobacterales bacterium]